MQDPNPNPNTNPAKKHAKAPIIICIAFALAGIAFGIWGVIQVFRGNGQISALKSENAEKDSQIANLETQIDARNKTIVALKAERTSSTGNIEEKNCAETNPYSIFSSNLANNPSWNVQGYYYHWTGTTNSEKSVVASIDKQNHLKIEDVSSGYDANAQVVAEADGAISVYFLRLGNGSVPYFYIINKDGSVSRIEISENGSRAIEKVSGYSNIVSIVQGGDMKAWLIDIKGNIYKTY